MRKLPIHTTVAVAAMLLAVITPAKADTLVQLDFEVPYYSDPPVGPVVDGISYQLTLPESPQTIPKPQNAIFGGPTTFWVHANGKFLFFGPSLIGYTFDDPYSDQYPRAYTLFETQVPIFSGPVTAPAFLPGTYALNYDAPVFGYGIDPGTLTISLVGGGATTPAPEPASLLLLATGTLILAAATYSLKRRNRNTAYQPGRV